MQPRKPTFKLGSMCWAPADPKRSGWREEATVVGNVDRERGTMLVRFSLTVKANRRVRVEDCSPYEVPK